MTRYLSPFCFRPGVLYSTERSGEVLKVKCIGGIKEKQKTRGYSPGDSDKGPTDCINKGFDELGRIDVDLGFHALWYRKH